MRRLIRSAGSTVAGLLIVGAVALLAYEQVPVPTGYPANGQPPVVKVVYPGAEPRRPIRYAIAKGRTEHLTMDMAMELALDMGGASVPSMPLPTMRMTADVAVTDVTSSGDATYAVALTDFTLVDAANVDPKFVAALQGASFDVKAVSGAVTISARGISRNAKIDTRKITNPQMAQMIDRMSSTIQQLALPFPEEAVGSGAEWDVRQALTVDSVHTFQKIVVDLVSLDDASCTLRLLTEQTAPPQPVTAPNIPAGVHASLENMRGAGNGTMTIRFDSLVPTSQASLSSSAVINIGTGGTSQQVSTRSTVRLKVSPAK